MGEVAVEVFGGLGWWHFVVCWLGLCGGCGCKCEGGGECGEEVDITERMRRSAEVRWLSWLIGTAECGMSELWGSTTRGW